jgi:hypothetical protein
VTKPKHLHKKGGVKARPFAERFNEKIDRSRGPESCWPWIARLTGAGYGTMSNGETQRSIARDYPVSRAMVGHIVRGANWSHVADSEAA